MSVSESIQTIKDEIGTNVKLVAVSKTKPISDIKEAYAAGQLDFGENKVQELGEKASQLPDVIQWHFIGHLQRNKVKFIAPFVHLIHSVDSEKLLKEIDKRALNAGRKINCLLQVFIADEETKFGLSPDEIRSLVQEDISAKYPNINICGLMGMATNTDEKDQVRREFSLLKSLFDELKSSGMMPASFNTLSMGMTGDYKIAISEGSTMIRIGSLIFGDRGQTGVFRD